MLQYLFNATAIWLLSLVVFDLFLRRESFHNYNRAYLVLTFFAGLVMPLFTLNGYVAKVFLPADQPLRQVNVAKAELVNSVTPAATAINFEMILMFIYLVGLSVGLALLCKELYTLMRYYGSGKKYQEGEWMIIETGRAHSPFSLFRLLFVADKSIYTKEEWNIISAHEYEHYRLLHFADLLFFQLAKCIFWFHPPVYVFTKRLQLVHEFQADDNALKSSSRYGKFLLEQSMLATAPSISHSFNHSPIKNRIFMLTHKSPKIRLTKLVLVLPLTLACIIFFTKSGYSFKERGNTVMFKGNVVEFSGPPATPASGKPVDMGGKEATLGGQPGITVEINSSDAAITTGKLQLSGDGAKADESIRVSYFSSPVRLNGEPVYSEGDITTDPEYTGEGTFEQYIFDGMKKELDKLDDGMYFVRLSYLIIDKNDRVAYYSNDGIVPQNIKKPLDEATKAKLKNMLGALTEQSRGFRAGTLNGQAVNAYLAWGFNMHNKIVVRDHNASLL